MPDASDGIALPGPGSGTSRPMRGMVALRLALGALWCLNLIYIFDPANQFWTGFSSTASSYESSSLGGGALALFVAGHPTVFAVAIAGVTVYLAVAFLLGLTTRAACLVGAAFNIALLVTQFAQISTFPGATDVGAQPLYLAMYVAIFLGYDRAQFTLDRAVNSAWGRWIANRERRLPGVPQPARVPASNPGGVRAVHSR
jgi:hypothetical protein